MRDDEEYAALFERSLAEIRRLKQRVRELEQGREAEPVAVVGIGCRFPGGVDSPDALWRVLEAGREAITRAPEDRWCHPKDLPREQHWGGFLDDVWGFDAGFFGVSSSEAQSLDPQQRLLLETGWEALERAGRRPAALRGSSSGVFVGLSSNDHRFHLEAGGTAAVDPYWASGNWPAFAAGRISYTLGLHGPSVAVDTACSSSLVAVHLAMQALRARECDLALAGGANLMLSEITSHMLARTGALSSDGRCRVFDAHANGFVRGEGAAMIVLRRLSDAEADGDPILGVLCASVVNQDGRSTGLTAPNGQAQQAMVREALRRAGLSPDAIDYVEAHGTGTTLGDPIEFESLQAVLGAARADGSRCFVGSLKPNLGHLEAAAGIAGLIKVLVSLEHESIPRQINFSVLNPRMSLDGRCLAIPGEASVPWRRGARPRVAGVSSFGLSGTNAHVLVREGPEVEAELTLADADHPTWLGISARTPTALRTLAGAYARRLETCRAAELASLCWSAGTTRERFEVRASVHGSTPAELAAALRELGGTPVANADVGAGARALVFTGQGSQYPNMAAGLRARFEVFADALRRCDAGLRGAGEEPISELVYGADDGRLAQTRWTQPALFAVEYALYCVWSSLGVEPDVVLGHSLGEYVAACVAGVFSLDDALALVSLRGRLMQAQPPGAMVAATLPEELAHAWVQGHEAELAIAAYNAPGQLVFSGSEAAIERVVARLQEASAEHRRLHVSHAFHSPLMVGMQPELERALAATSMRAPRLPLVCNLTGAQAGPELASPRYFSRHVREPVDFASSVLHAAAALGVREWLELGPHPVLLGLVARTLGEAGSEHALVPSLRRGQPDTTVLLSALSTLYARGLDPNLDGLTRPAARRRVALPTSPFERRRYGGPTPRRRAELYALDWEPLAGLSSTPAQGRRWLLLADANGVAVELEARLQRHGIACERVPAGEQPPASALRGVEGVVDCSALDVEGAASDPSAAVYASCRASLTLAQRWLELGELPAVWWIVDSPSSSDAALDGVARASTRGLARVMGRELSPSRFGHVELEAASAANLDALAALVTGAYEERARIAAGRVEAARCVAEETPCGSPKLRADAAYLITGGLGGIGLQLADALIERGAAHLILVGRRGFDELDPSRRAALLGLQARATIEPWALDVADREALQRALAALAERGVTLAGVFHAAGVLRDAPLARHDAESFAAVTRAKVDGAFNLHALVGDVELFCLFSSVSALFGLAGQANYAAANATLDALAEARRRAGLPAVSIQWGPWDEVGMAHEMGARGRRAFTDQGIDYLPAGLAVRLLEGVLEQPPRPVLAALAMRWPEFEAAYGRRAQGGLLARVREPATLDGRATDAGVAAQGAPERGELSKRLAATEPSQRRRVCEQFVGETARRLLGLPDAAALAGDVALRDLGMDSLMIMELRNRLAAAIGASFAASELFSYPTVRRLAGFLLERVDIETTPASASASADDTTSDRALLDALKAELSAISSNDW